MSGDNGNLWDAIRRARLVRVLAVYLGASFAVIEAVDIFTNQFGLPDWFFPGAAVLLLVAFPVVVATALVQARPRRSAMGTAVAAAENEAVAAERRDMADIGASLERPAPHWLTWRKAIIGAVGALALWGLVVSGYMAMRTLGIGPVGSLVAAGVLDERERIIIAEFVNNTNDPHLGSVATEAFRIDLAQSPIVTVVDPAFVERTLARMEREESESIDLDVAREVAIREGIKAIVAGDISSVGVGYVLAARLVAAESGEALAAFRESAPDSTAIISAIDDLSRKLRERIGESLRTIRANEPLDEVTTSSIEALRKYSQAIKVLNEGDNRRGVSLLEEAVSLDSTFAMAWRKLGVTAPDRASRIEALKKAYQYRDRLTDRERYLTLGTYHADVTGEEEKAITAYESLLDIYPNDSWALNNLANFYNQRRDFARAAELYSRSIEVDSFSAVSYRNLIQTQVSQGQFEQAQYTVDRFREKLPDNPNADLLRSRLASAQGDYARAEELILEFAENRKGDRFARSAADNRRMELALIRGQIAEAERRMQAQMALAEEMGELAGLLQGAAVVGLWDIWFLGDLDGGLTRVEAALARYPIEDMQPLNRPYITIAQMFALGHQVDRARQYLAAQDSVLDEFQRKAIEDEVLGTLALIDIVEGRPQEALEKLQRTDGGGCLICDLPVLGLAYDGAGEADSTIAVFERYINLPWLYRDFDDGLFLPTMYERLGALYEARGEREKARYYYGKLAEQWEDADPELQPRVEAARRAMLALSSDA